MGDADVTVIDVDEVRSVQLFDAIDTIVDLEVGEPPHVDEPHGAGPHNENFGDPGSPL